MNALGAPWEHVETHTMSESQFSYIDILRKRGVSKENLFVDRTKLMCWSRRLCVFQKKECVCALLRSMFEKRKRECCARSTLACHAGHGLGPFYTRSVIEPPEPYILFLITRFSLLQDFAPCLFERIYHRFRMKY